MISRVSKFAACTLVSLFCSTAAWAPGLGQQGTDATAKRMAECNKSATGKTGDERKAYMSSCLRARNPPTS